MTEHRARAKKEKVTKMSKIKEVKTESDMWEWIAKIVPCSWESKTHGYITKNEVINRALDVADLDGIYIKELGYTVTREEM